MLINTIYETCKLELWKCLGQLPVLLGFRGRSHSTVLGVDIDMED